MNQLSVELLQYHLHFGMRGRFAVALAMDAETGLQVIQQLRTRRQLPRRIANSLDGGQGELALLVEIEGRAVDPQNVAAGRQQTRGQGLRLQGIPHLAHAGQGPVERILLAKESAVDHLLKTVAEPT